MLPHTSPSLQGYQRSGTPCLQSPGDTADRAARRRHGGHLSAFPSSFHDRSALSSLNTVLGVVLQEEKSCSGGPTVGILQSHTSLSCWDCCAFVALYWVFPDAGPGGGPAQGLWPALLILFSAGHLVSPKARASISMPPGVHRHTPASFSLRAEHSCVCPGEPLTCVVLWLRGQEEEVRMRVGCVTCGRSRGGSVSACFQLLETLTPCGLRPLFLASASMVSPPPLV